MPKQTAKYASAVALAIKLKIKLVKNCDQQKLYRKLNEQNYFWSSKRKVWSKTKQQSNGPAGLIRISVHASSSQVTDCAREISNFLADSLDFELIETVGPHVCRTLAQGESRIYLTFKQRSPRPVKPG